MFYANQLLGIYDLVLTTRAYQISFQMKIFVLKKCRISLGVGSKNPLELIERKKLVDEQTFSTYFNHTKIANTQKVVENFSSNS